jgi:hypothetical protein
VLRRSIGPLEHMQRVFAEHGLPMPEIAVETSSITAFRRRQGILQRPAVMLLAATAVDRDRCTSVPIALNATGLFVFPGAPRLDRISTLFRRQRQQHHLGE